MMSSMRSSCVKPFSLQMLMLVSCHVQDQRHHVHKNITIDSTYLQKQQFSQTIVLKNIKMSAPAKKLIIRRRILSMAPYQWYRQNDIHCLSKKIYKQVSNFIELSDFQFTSNHSGICISLVLHDWNTHA